MSLIKHIRSQSTFVRGIMFSLSVVTVLSLVGVVWFQSVQQNLYALLNPDTEDQQRFFAQTESPSPLASIGQLFASLRASITELFGGSSDEGFDTGSGAGDNQVQRARLLPLPANKR